MVSDVVRCGSRVALSHLLRDHHVSPLLQIFEALALMAKPRTAPLPQMFLLPVPS